MLADEIGVMVDRHEPDGHTEAELLVATLRTGCLRLVLDDGCTLALSPTATVALRGLLNQPKPWSLAA